MNGAYWSKIIQGRLLSVSFQSGFVSQGMLGNAAIINASSELQPRFIFHLLYFDFLDYLGIGVLFPLEWPVWWQRRDCSTWRSCIGSWHTAWGDAKLCSMETRGDSNWNVHLAFHRQVGGQLRVVGQPHYKRVVVPEPTCGWSCHSQCLGSIHLSPVGIYRCPCFLRSSKGGKQKIRNCSFQRAG